MARMAVNFLQLYTVKNRPHSCSDAQVEVTKPSVPHNCGSHVTVLKLTAQTASHWLPIHLAQSDVDKIAPALYRATNPALRRSLAVEYVASLDAAARWEFVNEVQARQRAGR